MKPASTTAQRGILGEDVTTQKLIADGFTIKARNFRKPYGEVDIIAQKGSLLVFVEVKLRTNNRIDLGELIVPKKQKRMISVAKAFLSFHTNDELICRFDVSLVTLEQNNTIQIDYIPDAFNAYE